ncbi:hypothetical protein CC78DRAFT_612685 [Lojkania enalia]|uniref:Protein kinase domain-containing protein n=1 Tax=Lojkania enalia TaxID=147567 RepID=A0A9P4N9R8_9PLEO|nr:hypothetical protein CC78DRAFT_612685 [Didymosphaeria enalia]
MADFEHEALYPTQSSSMLGNAQGFYWPSNSAPEAPIDPAPPPHLLGLDGNLDAYPFSDPGSLSFISPSALQNLAQDGPMTQEVDWNNHSDILVDPIVGGTVDSGYQTSAQPHDQQYSTAPDLAPRKPQDQLPSILHRHLPYHQGPYIPTSYPIPGGDGSVDVRITHSHSTPMQNTYSHDALPQAVGKRCRDIHSSAYSTSEDPCQPANKLPRIDGAQLERPSINRTAYMDYFSNDTGLQPIGELNQVNPSNVVFRLTKNQKSFIRRYHEFARTQQNSYLDRERANALSILIGVPTQTILEYSNKKIMASTANYRLDSANAQGNHLYADRKQKRLPPSGYSITEAYKHIPPEYRTLVEKYVQAHRSRRAQSDGRRRVNDGPMKCTHGCGYRTSRSFDWRRHEQTHQPQELWLCHRCCQNGETNPFLVNRKDKLLKHAKEAHKGWDPSELLERSKLDFHADYNPQCPECPEICDSSWDDWCKHVLGHYEDAAHPNSRNTVERPPSNDRTNSTSNGESSNPDSQSDSTDSSDDEDDDSPPSHPPSNRKDGTGGSGGGSGTIGGGLALLGTHGSGSQWGSSAGRTRYHDSYSGGGQSTYSQRGMHVISEQSEAPPTTRMEFILNLDSVQKRKLDHSEGIHTLSAPPVEIPHLEKLEVSNQPFFQHSSLSRSGLSSYRQRSFLPFLGNGSHGSVDTVQEYESGRVFARKRSGHKTFPREVEIMKNLHHPHVVQFVAAYTQDSLLNLIMSPVAEFTLGELLTRSNTIASDIDRTFAWIGCLSSALAYIHSRRIRHADIKPHNILVRGHNVFISDFGISRLVSEPDSTSSSNSPSTPLYAPLEISEHLPHGRKADIFSLGCVVLEVLSLAQGKSLRDLHNHLGFIKRKTHLPGNSLAYYKVNGKLMSWISMMQRNSNESTRRIWGICQRMLQDRIDLRPSAKLLLEEIREALEEGGILVCATCAFGPPRVEEIDYGHSDVQEETNSSYSYTREPLRPRLLTYSITASRTATTLSPRQIAKTTPNAQPDSRPGLSKDVKPTTQSCTCIIRKKRSSALLGLFGILLEYEQDKLDPSSLELPSSVGEAAAYQSPPAYEAPSTPVSTSVLALTIPGQPHTVAQKVGSLIWDSEARNLPRWANHFLQDAGKAEELRGHEIGSHRLPKVVRAHGLCHMCSTRFVAPRLEVCRNCFHIRCEKCTSLELPPDSRAPCQDLAEIGSHLHPPAYSLHDESFNTLAGNSAGGPLKQLLKEAAVLDLVIAETSSLGNNPGERFIQERPSTFDRIHSPARSPDQLLSPRTSFSSAIDTQFQLPLSGSGSSGSTTYTSLSSIDPRSKRARLHSPHFNNASIRASLYHNHSRQGRQQGRQFISGRSKQTVYIREPRAMNDHNRHTTTLDSQELKSRLEHIQKPTPIPYDGDPVSEFPRMSKSQTTTSDTTAVISKMPTFRKSQTASTSSTTDSNGVSKLEVVRAFPMSRISTEPIEVGVGEFSKPTIKRRRDSSGSSKSHKEFQYYGRHANSWLFNDFSITDSVKRGWRAVAGKKEGEE